jgi:hypothetical protein
MIAISQLINEFSQTYSLPARVLHNDVFRILSLFATLQTDAKCEQQSLYEYGWQYAKNTSSSSSEEKSEKLIYIKT